MIAEFLVVVEAEIFLRRFCEHPGKILECSF
jgi:hypothetical protein